MADAWEALVHTEMMLSLPPRGQPESSTRPWGSGRVAWPEAGALHPPSRWGLPLTDGTSHKFSAHLSLLLAPVVKPCRRLEAGLPLLTDDAPEAGVSSSR